MVAPDSHEIGVFLVLAEVEVVEEIAFEKGGVFEGGELKVAGVGFGRRKKIVFGLFGNVSLSESEKSDGKKPEKMRNKQRNQREKGGAEVLETIFLFLKILDKERQKNNKEDKKNSFDVEGGGGEEGDKKEDKKAGTGGAEKIIENDVKQPGEEAIEPGKSFKRDKESLEGAEVEEVVKRAKKRGKLSGFGVEFAFEEVVVKEEINTERAEDQRKEGGEVADEGNRDAEGHEEGNEKGTGKVGSFGHATEETKAAVLLPDGGKNTAQIFGEVVLGVKAVPAGEGGARLVVEED